MHFYDMHWNNMGTKASLAREIEAITRIDEAYLTGARNFQQACIAVKMSWMSGRKTTKEEDIAYGMLGLFNVTMSPQYGEGQRAFIRLQHQLLSTTTDESLLAWRMPDPTAGHQFGILPGGDTAWKDDECGMLAPNPEWFRECRNVTIQGGPKIERTSQNFELTR